MAEARPRWVDSHAHLAMLDDDALDGALERSAAAGVIAVLAPATGGDDLERTLGLPRSGPVEVVVAVGVHPHEAASLDDRLKGRLRAAVEAPGVAAVGEIGLDYHYMNSPREEQLGALEWQLALAEEAGLPVVLHNRESFDDLAPILERWSGRVAGVCHSFTEPPEAVERVVAAGFHVGVSGMVTFKRADNIREMAAAIPLDRLLVETDAPYLAPVPHRGEPNQPAWVVPIGEAVARVLARPPAEIAEHTTANFRRLFAVG